MPLTIALWNDNGLAHYTNEVKLFPDIDKINVLFVSETYFT